MLLKFDDSCCGSLRKKSRAIDRWLNND